VITLQSVLGRLKDLPTLSAAAVRLSELARDERTGAADFEKVIRPDPALTANVLRVVNSAYFGLRCRVDSVRQAITLLGLKRTSEVAAAAALAPVIPPRLPGYELEAAGFWTHCVAVAVLSERLAAELGVRRPELTFTAGLLHDIGKIAISAFVSGASGPILERARGGLAFVSAEREVLGVDHTDVGGAVAAAWHLPAAVTDVARWHHAPGLAGEGTDRHIIDLVHVADGLAHAMGLGADVGELARKVDPGAETRLGIRARRLERVAGQSLDEIRDLAQVFASVGGGAR
jgi:putative nucleotidyltransferase with HDIG domain